MSFIFPTRNMSDKAALVKGHSLRFIGIHFFVFRELWFISERHSFIERLSIIHETFVYIATTTRG